MISIHESQKDDDSQKSGDQEDIDLSAPPAGDPERDSSRSASVANRGINTRSGGRQPMGSANRNMPRERCGMCFRRRWVRVIFRGLNFLAICVFSASAALQYNDDDGFLWAAIYLAAAVFCVLAELSWRQLRTYIFRPLLLLFTVSSGLGACYILIARLLLRKPAEGIDDPEAHEFMGLALVTIWMTVVLILDRYNVVGLFRGYLSLAGEHERDKEGHVQMGEVLL